MQDIRRTLDHLQKTYDQIQSRYSSQTKTKEPSALREDAFQLHEARKSYLKVSMDFCAVAPQLRNSLDKLLVRTFFDQWKEMKSSRESTASTFGKWSQEMDRIRGWTRELEGGERTFRRELHAARREIEETAEAAARPSRELEDYSVSTVPYLGSGGMSTVSLKSPGKPGLGPGPAKSEKQGWLYLRTYSGKPTRTVWVRRWGFVKNGIFGWLIQGARSSGVEESERIGVLLCNVRPAFQEERRFCFEVKTKNNAMMLQAETQAELMDWISTFEAAKQKALDNPASTDIVGGGKGGASSDPAFSISPPPAPEFAATLSDSLSPQSVEEQPGPSFDRSSTLPVPGTGDAAFIRSSVDVSNPRRPTFDKDAEGSRDHASRIIQKLDLHRKSTAGPATSSGAVTPSPATPIGGGGIASLISASHNLHNMLPVGSGMVSTAAPDPTKSILGIGSRDMAPSSLAPSTLANPPAPTSLSQAAVNVSGERGIGVGRADTTGGMPSGIMANLWGSSNWGYLNRLDRGELRQPAEPRPSESPMPSPKLLPAISPPKGTGLGLSFEENQRSDSIAVPDDPSAKRSQTPSPNRHRSTISLDGDAAKLQRAVVAYPQEFPNYYPIQLKTQDAQFRLLFPNVRRSEKVVLVFRATWNPNDQQEFPGRAYVTTQDIYFYSNHLGLVLTSGLGLSSVSEVTAAPGKDCDFLFLHMEQGKDEEVSTRVTIKTFLEPLKLLQMRLNYLIRNSGLEEQDDLETVIKTLIKLETDEPHSSPSLESWEDVSLNTPVDEGARLGRAGHSRKISKDLKAPIHVDRALNGDPRLKDVAKFKLPSRPIEYVPQGSLHVAVEKQFSISPKALFHVLFGDKSAVWQLLYHERHAQGIKQGPWVSLDKGHLGRDFEYEVDAADLLGRVEVAKVSDYQLIDVLNDHLCYVVTDKRTPWHLPYRHNFMLVTKIVITHVAKSKSKIAMFTKVDWLRSPPILKKVIEQQAMEDLNQDALDLADLVSDQVRRLGAHSRTKKAIDIFGAVGQETQVSHFGGGDSPLDGQRRLRRRTFSNLLYETVGSFMESAVSSVMMWAIGIIRWAWKISSAHGIILLILLLSALVNGFFWTRDGYEWWHERNAGKFLSRVGVMPNMVMSKAIYMNDMDDAVGNMTGLVTGDSSSWLVMFLTVCVYYTNPSSSATPRSALITTCMISTLQPSNRLPLHHHRHTVCKGRGSSLDPDATTSW